MGDLVFVPNPLHTYLTPLEKPSLLTESGACRHISLAGASHRPVVGARAASVRAGSGFSAAVDTRRFAR